MIVDGQFRTGDMALATVLVVHGYTPMMERKNPPYEKSVQWIFQADEGLADIIKLYDCKQQLVEPLEFIRAQKKVREQLYEFLGTNTGRRLVDRR